MALDLSNLSVSETQMPASSRPGRASSLVALEDNPFYTSPDGSAGILEVSYERKQAFETTVETSDVPVLERMIRQAAGELNLGVSVVFCKPKSGERLNYVSVGDRVRELRMVGAEEAYRGKTVTVKYVARERRKYDKKSVVGEGTATADETGF